MCQRMVLCQVWMGGEDMSSSPGVRACTAMVILQLNPVPEWVLPRAKC